MKTKTTYKIALTSMMVALSVSIDLFSLKTDTSKFTIYALPLLLSGMMYGPLIGGLTGLISGFISQIISYGLTPTTIIWILAPCFWGLSSGFIAKLFKYSYDKYKIAFNVTITSIIVLIINTIAMILDGLIYHYATTYVYTNLIMRISIALFIDIFYITAISLILPKVTNKIGSTEEKIKILSSKHNNEIDIKIKIKK